MEIASLGRRSSCFVLAVHKNVKHAHVNGESCDVSKTECIV